MRKIYLACAIAAVGCGSNSSGSKVDATGGGSDGATADSAPAATNVAVTLTNHPTNAASFDFIAAYQDGDGAWTAAPAPTGDVYTLPITTGRYGVAWSCVTATGAARAVSVTYATITEHPSLTLAIPAACTDRITTFALTGNISGRAVGPTAVHYTVSFGTDSATVGSGGDFAMRVPAATHDLVVTEAPTPAVIGGNATADEVVDKVAVMRGVAVTAATAQNVDFATAVAIQSYTATATTPGAGTRAVAATVLYANGTTATLVRDATTPFETEALGATQGSSTDVYDQAITESTDLASATVSNETATPAAQTYVAPAAFGGVLASSAASTSYPQIKTTWTPYTGAVGYTWTGEQDLTSVAQCGGAITACTVTWTAQMTAGWVGSAASYQVPDLSALAGWNAELQPIAGVAITGTVRATVSSAGVADFPAMSPPVAGTTRSAASSTWNVTP